jgi:hypothetical protein
MLHTSGHYLTRSSAPLVGIHQCFIAPRYLTSWGGGARRPVLSPCTASPNLRPPGSSWRPSSVVNRVTSWGPATGRGGHPYARPPAPAAGEGSEQSARSPPLPHTRLDSRREAPQGVWLRSLADRRQGVFGYYRSSSVQRVMLVQSRQSRLDVRALALISRRAYRGQQEQKIGPDRTLDSPGGARISMSNLTRGLELA